ncbi:MAG: dihydrolipoamide acetyltransferase family protein [Ketobacteraceae bacterium]|nr:dihydrolipoamide acetyltransferase family protein [Ketobacteraceae bacterium]
MKYFKLPDLGEGLQEAEIVEWHVKPGDSVETDQLIISVETAKAIVDVPSPQSGQIAALFGKEGDIVHIGEPLVEYAGQEQEDSGTVVGKMSTGTPEAEQDHFIIGSADSESQHNPLATPAIRALAKRLNVDLSQVEGSGKHNMITAQDVERAAQMVKDFGEATPLRGVRRAMAKNMEKAHREVVKVTINDDVDIHAWYPGQDPTMRLVRAIASACRKEPNMNAWYDGNAMTMRVLDKVDLGIAVDTPDGLFVPVLRDISHRNLDDLRKGLDRLRADVKSRKIPPAEMTGATITLSNYGTIAGRYGNPVIVPPMVAILGAGKIKEEVVAFRGEIVIHPVMPLALSFDHRAITGGEAARFLKAVMDDLEADS